MRQGPAHDLFRIATGARTPEAQGATAERDHLRLAAGAPTYDGVIHACPCCGHQYTVAGWRALPLDGHMDFDDPPYRIQLRTCRCGSTMGVGTDLDGRLCDDRGELLHGGPARSACLRSGKGRSGE